MSLVLAGGAKVPHLQRGQGAQRAAGAGAGEVTP
jgi:hypothetical protein